KNAPDECWPSAGCSRSSGSKRSAALRWGCDAPPVGWLSTSESSRSEALKNPDGFIAEGVCKDSDPWLRGSLRERTGVPQVGQTAGLPHNSVLHVIHLINSAPYLLCSICYNGWTIA